MVKNDLLQRELTDKVSLRITGCHGFCEMGPFILTEPQNALYVKLKREDVPRIVDAVLKDEYVEDLLYRDPASGKICYSQDEIPFFARQERQILSGNQEIDPIRFLQYISNGGYLSLEKVFADPNPEWVLEEVKKSGLRGRGGGGFPTGVKWEAAAKADGRSGKYVVCNADEGDPGAYMDRSILEGNPHSVIEGMIVGAYSMGATEGFIFVRSEYPLAIKHTVIALHHAREYGLLGKNILGTGFDYDISIVRSAGAFVCGEETALIRTIEGKVGEPRQRPPYPTEKGIFGKPTVINNVETWANVPLVFKLGADEYAKSGAEGNSGTKVFSLVGKVKNTGLVEVPMGASIKEIVHDIGGGAPEGGQIKAIQIGGPSGGCIPASRFDLPIDYDSLNEAGAIMGSGGLIVMDEDTCMVDVAKYFMSFLKDESCGKCYTCRKGTQRLYEILEDISKGNGTLAHLDLLQELAQVVQDTSMCGLGRSAPNPVLSTLRYFREEYIRHIEDKRCDAFVCADLVGAPCHSACPVDTEAWRYVAHIARGEYEEAYQAIREPNPFPSVCGRTCDHKCESRCKLGVTGHDPVAIRALKRFVTDSIEPSAYKPEYKDIDGERKRVAVVGSGPAGLTAAHHLSLSGHQVTVFEAEDRPGGMLVAGIPEFRLPRDILEKEIATLIDDNITLECNKALGRDFTVDSLFDDGYEAAFLALGAHKSKLLRIDGEDSEGVFPSIEFLKSWNLRGESQAKGHVGVIGGGNSAIDAARVAVRQEGVETVTIYYRRTRREMPAFEAEIEEALEEGIELKVLVTPVQIEANNGRIEAITFLENDLGDPDGSGRRRPIPRDGSEFSVKLDTLVVAISEEMEPFGKSQEECGGVEVAKWGAIVTDEKTQMTRREGVFAAGDAVTGPNTVIDAIAAGKKVAGAIERYLNGEPLTIPATPCLPSRYVEPVEQAEVQTPPRVGLPRVAMNKRRTSFAEVEGGMTEADAVREAGRCLRCDLEFTKPAETTVEAELQEAGGVS